MIEKAPIQSKEEKKRLPRVRRAGRFALAVAGVAVVSGLALLSKTQLEGNWDDTKDLQEFTSPAMQQERQDTQDAFDALEEMQDHFEEQGGITDEQAEAMGPVVGLEPDEIKQLLSKRLFRMDYDGDVPEASSSEATKGLLAAAVAGGIIVGTVGAATFVALKPNRTKTKEDRDDQ